MVQDLLSWTKNHFEGLGIAEPRLEAEVLLAHALKLDRMGLYVQHDRPSNPEERESFGNMINEGKGSQRPIYGRREFMSSHFCNGGIYSPV